MGLGGGFHVPLQQRATQGACKLFGQHGFACSGFSLDKQGALKCKSGIDCQFEIVGSNVLICSVKSGCIGSRIKCHEKVRIKMQFTQR